MAQNAPRVKIWHLQSGHKECQEGERDGMKGFSITVTEKGRMCCVAIVAALLLVFAFGSAAPAQASADEGALGLTAGGAQITTQATDQEEVGMRDPEWTSMWAGDKDGYSISYFLSYANEELEITNVTSSNSSVLKVTHSGSDNKIWSWSVSSPNAGSATLTVTYKKDGVEKKISETYTSKAFPDAITSIKFNGTALAIPTSKKYVDQDTIYGFKGKSGKLEVKLASGWKIGSLSESTYDKNHKSLSQSEISNGETFSIEGKAQFANVYFNIYNDKGDNYNYSLYVYRNLPLQLSAKAVYYIGYPAKSRLPYSAIYGDSSNIKVTKVTSSNKSVIAVKKNKDLFKVVVQAKKAGTAKITVKYTFNGKPYTASAKCTASKDYPVKSVLVNNKSVKLKKNPYSYLLSKYKKGTGKVKITAAKGWQVKSLKYYSDVMDYYNQGKGTTIKGGKSFKTEADKEGVVIATLKKKKGKTSFTYAVYFDRR